MLVGRCRCKWRVGERQGLTKQGAGFLRWWGHGFSRIGCCGEEGFGTFDVLCPVNEGGKGAVELEKVLHVSAVGRLLADDAKSTCKSGADADQVLEGLDGHAVELGQRQSVARGRLFELFCVNFACLKEADDLFC